MRRLINKDSHINYVMKMPFKDPIKKKEYDREYLRKNRERINERSREYHRKNREKYLKWRGEYYQKNKEKICKRIKKWREENPEKYKEHARKTNRSPMHKIYHLHWRDRLQLEVLSHYSDKSMDFPHCACCKEIMLDFLEIDHINNNGAEERRKLGFKGRGIAFYTWLKRNNYPEGYQVLCANCNKGKARNKGICPHQKLDIS